MADDNKLDFILDLDDTQFARTVIDSIGRVEALATSLEGVAIAAGVVGAAYLAVKTALDLTLEAENVKAINSQFEILAKQAGLAGDVIKEGMVRAAGGLVDSTELLQLANRAVIDLGASASRLPEIMELARQVSMLTGRDIAQTFQEIEQAIASGRTVTLKNYGIIIDSQKAYENYARSLGIAANELSEVGKQHAILNQALEIGHQKYQNVDVDIKEATNSWQAFKIILSDVGEMATLTFDKLAGPSIRSALNWLKDWANGSRNALKATFGDGAEAAAAKADYLKQHIDELRDHLHQLQDQQSKIKDPYQAATNAQSIDTVKDKLSEAERAYLSALRAKRQFEGGSEFIGPMQATGTTSGPADSGNGNVDLEQRKRNQAQFQRDINALQQEALDQRKQMMTSEVEAEQFLADQKAQIRAQNAARIAEIESSQTLNPAQKAQEEQMIRDQETQQIALVEQQRVDIHRQAAENIARIDQDTAAGFANGWRSSAATAKNDLNNWSKAGQKASSAFTGNAAQAFMKFGAGMQSATDAAKGFIFGFMADVAEAEGRLLLAAGLAPPPFGIGPAGIAAGGALLALSGLIRGMGATSSGVGSGGGGAGGGGGATNFGSAQDGPALNQEQQKSKAVTIQIQGHYFETEQTKTRLVEMIREASDATDYTIT